MTLYRLAQALTGTLAPLLLGIGGSASAAASNQPVPAPGSAPVFNPTYADLVGLLEPAALVLTVQIQKVAALEPARATDVRPGWVRMYVEARAATILRGATPPGLPLSYLVDVPLSARGKPPALAKREVMVVARPVMGHPEMIQLVAPDAELDWNPALAARVDAVLRQLQAPDAPGPIGRVREAIYVPGTLVGEGETQIFLATADGSPAAISVLHQPGTPAGQTTSWSVSFSEVVDASGQPPAHDTLAWYRLACTLPAELPASSNVSATPEDQAQAVADYHLVMTGLGPCTRTPH